MSANIISLLEYKKVRRNYICVDEKSEQGMRDFRMLTEIFERSPLMVIHFLDMKLSDIFQKQN